MTRLNSPARRPSATAPAARLHATSLRAAVFAAVLLAGGASAQTAAPPATGAPAQAAPAAKPDPAEVQRRVRALSHELRCLVCQNQTLADSGADLAGDLLRQVTTQVASGKTDDEVKAYLVARYGDFVLYRPPLKGTTAALWIGPFALLLVGAGVFVVVQRRQGARGQAAAAGNATGSASASDAVNASAAASETNADREQAKKLLG